MKMAKESDMTMEVWINNTNPLCKEIYWTKLSFHQCIGMSEHVGRIELMKVHAWSWQKLAAGMPKHVSFVRKVFYNIIPMAKYR